MENKNTRQPTDPRSNVAKVGSYDPDKYAITTASSTVTTDEALTPMRPARLTQNTIGLYLRPLTYAADEVPPRPTIAELPDAVIDTLMKKDKAFWVDKPGANAYELTDAFYRYGLTTEKVLPNHQSVFPRSYQYELECVKYRRLHACDGLKQPEGPDRKPVSAHCRDCSDPNAPVLSAFQLAWAEDPGQKRWRYYPDLTATLTKEEIAQLMTEVGRPFRNEACNWYNKNYPSVKYDVLMRKFSK